MKVKFTTEQIRALENEINNFFESKGIFLLPKMEFVQVAKALGFEVCAIRFQNEIDGSIYIENNEKKIGVKDTLGGKYLQFAVAHELGHYIRQVRENHGDEDNILFALRENIFGGADKSQLENEIDYLAAAMLVPMYHFSKQIKALGIGADVNYDNVDEKVKAEVVELLADYYGVSYGVIRKRIADCVGYSQGLTEERCQ